MANEELLASWNDTATRQRIVDFVARVTTDGPDFVVPPDRVATFDNDGTLWCEKPLPIQLAFILEQLAKQATNDESLQSKQPWKAAYTHDLEWLSGVITKHYAGDDSDVKVLMGGILGAFAGVTVDEYGAAADRFVRGTTHPSNGRRFQDCGYQPMVELLRYLEANDFVTFIASGGDRDFMRPFADDIYSIPPERVIGSSNALRYDDDARTVAYLSEPDVFDDGPVKPVRIWSRVGRHPLLAGGNSNGDIPMLRYAVRDASAHPPRRRRARVRLHRRRRDGPATGGRRGLDRGQRQGRLVDRLPRRQLTPSECSAPSECPSAGRRRSSTRMESQRGQSPVDECGGGPAWTRRSRAGAGRSTARRWRRRRGTRSASSGRTGTRTPPGRTNCHVLTPGWPCSCLLGRCTRGRRRRRGRRTSRRTGS